MPMKTKCLLCNRKLLDHQTLMQYIRKDELCSQCRRSLKTEKKVLELDGLKVTAFHLYDDVMSECLIQYKECMDEALKDMFLFDVKDWIHLRYHHCVFLCAPSTKQDVQRRGFQHVIRMFESCGIEIIDCFEKRSEVSQKKKTREERYKIEQDIKVHLNRIPLHKRIVLIDDVATTGSTLLAMQKLIGENRCKEAICVAVHPKLVTEYDKKRKRKRIYFN